MLCARGGAVKRGVGAGWTRLIIAIIQQKCPYTPRDGRLSVEVDHPRLAASARVTPELAAALAPDLSGDDKA